MKDDIKILDVVALTGDLEARGLVKGQVGTDVEIRDIGVFEVGVCDDDSDEDVVVQIKKPDLFLHP
jgi:hypothetical protein